MEQERRFTVATELEVRARGDARTLTGYAAVFGRYSQDLGGFVERIMPGAFTKTIAEGDVRALVNHDPSRILGRSRQGAGTLKLSEDSTGLHYEVSLPGTTAARDLAESVERGDVSGSSFAFSVVGPEGQEWGVTEQDYPLRSVLQARLFDVGPVTYPAYDATNEAVAAVAVRSLAQKLGLGPADLKGADAIRAAITNGTLPGDPGPEQPSIPDAWLERARMDLQLLEALGAA
jgi:uncharacterized protein